MTSETGLDFGHDKSGCGETAIAISPLITHFWSYRPKVQSDAPAGTFTRFGSPPFWA